MPCNLDASNQINQVCTLAVNPTLLWNPLLTLLSIYFTTLYLHILNETVMFMQLSTFKTL